MNILAIENLKKSFRGQPVIENLNLLVPEHCVYGFLGQNGAGKTTTMKMILGLLKPDGGKITVCGEPAVFGGEKTNRFIGYLPDVPAFYSYMTAKEYLALCGAVCSLSRAQAGERSAQLLEMVGLSGCKKRIGGYSRGMKQRLGIAQALLHRPRLLICDEPTSALDPVGRSDILTILENVKKETTVLFSTHILSDAEHICDRIAILHHGSLVTDGTLEEIRSHKKHSSVLIEFYTPEDKERFASSPQVSRLLSGTMDDSCSLTVKSDDLRSVQAAVISTLAKENIQPIRFEAQEPTLEALFMEAVK